MKKIILWLTITLILCGCVDRAVVERERYKQMCQTWVGHDENELIRTWGHPQQVNNMPNGNKVYTYFWSANRRMPVLTLPGQTTYQHYYSVTGNQIYGTTYQNQGMGLTVGGNVVTYYCKTNFEINADGQIVYWRFDGNSCIAPKE
jgi:hypothetical protein